MTCEHCGYVFAPFETNCPRCTKTKTPTGTRRLVDLMKTRHLIQLEQCANCRFMIFPGDERCTSCGAPIARVGPSGKAMRGWSFPTFLGVTLPVLVGAVITFGSGLLLVWLLVRR